MSTEDATLLLSAVGAGDEAAKAALMPLVYQELRALAGKYIEGKGRSAMTLQPTAIVHEAFLRLIRQDACDFKSRTHFFAAAAGAMRHVLIDHARFRNAEKRGGGEHPRTLIETDGFVNQGNALHDILVLNELLERLAELSPRAARVVDLRVFGGLGGREIASQLNVSESTIKGDWKMARAWLCAELKESNDDA